MSKIIKEYKLNVDDSLSYNQYFQTVLENLPEKAVILIDECDKPILNYITDPVKAAKGKEILKGFYSISKSFDAQMNWISGLKKSCKQWHRKDLYMPKRLDLKYANGTTAFGFPQKILGSIILCAEGKGMINSPLLRLQESLKNKDIELFW